MKQLILFLSFLFLVSLATAQRVGINETGAAPHSSAILDVASINKGLLIPRMTGSQRALIPSPANGLIVYQTDNSVLDGPPGFYLRDNSVWKRMARADELGWIVSGTDIYTTTPGEVGIGTSSPSASAVLDMTSTSRGVLIPRMTSTQRTAIAAPAQGLMVFQNNGTSSLGFWYHDGTTWQRFAKASELTGSDSWTVAGDDQYSNVDGNVGIGLTTGISEKLTLRGDLFIQNDTITDEAQIIFQSQTGNTGAGGLITFQEPDNTIGAQIRYRPLYNVISMSNEISDDGVIHIYENGNVGIGGNFITDAVARLHVQSGNPQANYIDNGYMQVGPSSGGENLVFGRDEILARYDGSPWPLQLQEEGGSVKIGSGTVGADTKLHIFGGGESSLTTHGFMVLGSISGSNMVLDPNEIQARLNGAATTLRLQQDGGSLLVQGGALTVGTTGNVGIGDLTPDVPLDVEGDAIFNGTDPTVAFHQAGVQKGFAQLAGNNFRVGTFGDNNLGSFVVRTNGGDRFFVAPSGNVGVGTSNPLGKLDVAGNLRIVHSGEAIGIDGNNNFMQWYQNGVAKSYMQQLGNNLHISTSSGNSTGDIHIGAQQIFLGAAEVAINTSGPAVGYSLSVGGEIICEELRVELQGSGPWPDYVFADDYKLRSLDELKSFVTLNKHLPNIPAAAQVESEGFDVGDMNRRLLEKVEELTLYLIQQQEQIDEMKKIIEGLK